VRFRDRAGTSGEFNALSLQERFDLFRVVRDAVAGRVPVVAAPVRSRRREAVALARETERLGAGRRDGARPVLLQADAGGRPTAISRPSRSRPASRSCSTTSRSSPGSTWRRRTVARLATAHANVLGIKDEAGINPTQMTEFLASLRPDSPSTTATTS
jgi:4-hydroxy-tetrahydrodipicolinate synthase